MKPLLDLEQLIDTQEHQIRISNYEKITNPNKIPILISGGVGDVIMDIPVAAAIAEYGPVEIYSTHPHVFNYFNMGRIPNVTAQPIPVPKYTWFIDVNTVARFRFDHLDFSATTCWEAKALWERQKRALSDRKIETLVRSHPLQDAALARYAREKSLDRRSFPLFSLGMTPKPYYILPRQETKKYITIHDGFELASQGWLAKNGRSNKQWDLSSWKLLVSLLHETYPGYEIYQLGSNTARPIEGVDHNLIDKTSLTEAFEIISHSSLHIDGDSGLVHAATLMGVPCVVLFGPTPDYFYGYKQNINIRSKNSCSDACYWLKIDWLVNCPIGWDHPQCMDAILIDEVFDAIKIILTDKT